MKCNCFTCPLGKHSYEQSLKIYDKLNIPYDYNEITYNIWCDKIGSKCGWFGYCDDAFSDTIKQLKKCNNIKQSTKRTTREKHIKHLKKLSGISRYPTPSMLITEKWDRELKKYVPIDKPYYTRCYIGSRTKYFKRYSNKKVRKYKGKIKNGNYYRRIYDYWCEIT